MWGQQTTYFGAGSGNQQERARVDSLYSGVFYYYAFPNPGGTSGDGQSTHTPANPQTQPVGNSFQMPVYVSGGDDAGYTYTSGGSSKIASPTARHNGPAPCTTSIQRPKLRTRQNPPTCPCKYIEVVDDSPMHSGMKGFYFVANFSGCATLNTMYNPINPSNPYCTPAGAAVFFHQQNSFAGRYEYGFFYDFTNPINSSWPFGFLLV